MGLAVSSTVVFKQARIPLSYAWMSETVAKVEIFVKKVVDVDYSHKLGRPETVINVYQERSQVYTEFSDAVQGFHKGTPLFGSIN